jgi:hypothetical protein
MSNYITVSALFLFAIPMCAQHGGARGGLAAGAGHGGGVLTPPAPAGRQLRSPVHRPAFRQRFGRDFFVPYDPLGGDNANDLSGDHLTGDYDHLSDHIGFAVPTEAHPVLNQYKWKDEDVAGGENSGTFTIALKDGSRLYPAATWLQNNKLYYLDAEGRQQGLSADRIDRNATQRLNEEKKLHLQLPPG